MISPKELIDILHGPRALYASLEELKRLYQKDPTQPWVQEAQSAMEVVLSEWSDEQVADFIVTHLLQPPHSTDFASRSPEELREFLNWLYRYFFDGLRLRMPVYMIG